MEKYIEYWIERQESKCISSFFEYNDDEKKNFIFNIFIEISMSQYPKMIFEKAKFEEIVNSYIDKLDIKNIEQKEGILSEMITGYFIEVNLTDKEENNLKFVHKSFLEFFSAKGIVKTTNNNNYKHTIFNENWSSEVYDFVYGAIKEKNKESTNPYLLSSSNNLLDKFIYLPIFKYVSLKLEIKLFFLSMILSTIITYFITNSIAYSLLAFYAGEIIFIIISLSIRKSKHMKYICKSYIIDFLYRKDMTHTENIISNIFRYTKNINSILIKDKEFRIKMFFNDFQEVYFTNVKFIKSTLNNLKFKDSALTDVKFIDSSINNIHFDNCILKDIDFSTTKISKDFLSLKIKKNLTLIKYKYQNYHMTIINTSPEQINSYTLESLKEFIILNQLNKKDLFLDDWIVDKLFNETLT